MKETLPDTAVRIMTAAEALLAEEGWESLSLNAVATRAGVSKAMVPYYFGSREGLLEALLDSVAAEHEAAAGGLICLILRGTSRGRRLQQAEDRLYDSFSVLLELLPQALRREGLRTRMVTARGSLVELLSTAAVAGEAGVEFDSDVGARGLCAVIDGLLLQSCVDAERAPFRLSGALMKFLAPRPETAVSGGRRE